MSFLKNQFLNVIEWNETDENEIFWMWKNQEIKKGSRLIIRPGQDAIFLHNGKIEGTFQDEGTYEIETEILPFLTTLSSFKFGFNAPLRAEVLFVNQKEFLIRWGTKNPIMIQAEGIKGGLPIRSFGTFTVKVDDYVTLIERIAGVKSSFKVEDVKERVVSILDPLLMKWISKEGKDMFNLQANAIEIAKGVKTDLSNELKEIGLVATDFTISTFSYPEKIQEMIEKTASHAMVDDLNTYRQVSMIDALSNESSSGMSDMLQSGVGMAMGVEMMRQMNSAMSVNNPTPTQTAVNHSLACPTCQAPISNQHKFCSECGTKIEHSLNKEKFCSECGEKISVGAKFCGNCGHKC